MHMTKKPVLSATCTTIYLVVYYVLFNADVSSYILSFMFLGSPLMMIWMIMSVLKDRSYKAQQLDEEEWGYADRDRKRFDH